MCARFVCFCKLQTENTQEREMPRCFMPKKHLKNRPGMTERATGGRRSPSPCVDLPPPPPPPPLLSPPPPPPASHETNGDDEPETNATVLSKSGSNVYRPPTPVNHTGKCRSVGLYVSFLFFPLIDCRLTCQLSHRALTAVPLIHSTMRLFLSFLTDFKSLKVFTVVQFSK